MNILSDRQVSVKGKPLGHVADPIFDPLRFAPHGMAEDGGLSLGWEEDPAEDPHDRCFARPVRADQAKNFSGPDLQIQAVNGKEGSKSAG